MRLYTCTYIYVCVYVCLQYFWTKWLMPLKQNSTPNELSIVGRYNNNHARHRGGPSKVNCQWTVKFNKMLALNGFFGFSVAVSDARLPLWDMCSFFFLFLFLLSFFFFSGSVCQQEETTLVGLKDCQSLVQFDLYSFSYLGMVMLVVYVFLWKGFWVHGERVLPLPFKCSTN